MDTLQTILKRRSIRKYQDIQIQFDIVTDLLIAGMAAPSARNQQPWEFYVISNKDKLDEIRNVAKNYDFNSPLMIVVCGNKQRSITQNDNDFWIQDCSAAVENILLAATYHNLGTVWCGIYPVEERTKKMKEVLNLEEHIIPMALIHVGYPDEEKEERTQFKAEYVHYID